MPDAKPRCATCKWWTTPETPGPRRTCKRFPPSASVPPWGRDNNFTVTHWPETFSYHWCGEHAPREANDGE